jgi:hypothetical protein
MDGTDWYGSLRLSTHMMMMVNLNKGGQASAQPTGLKS